MEKVTQRMKAQLITLVMLCVSMAAMADENGVLIDGVYYDLRNSWSYYYYDANGNYQNQRRYNVAVVTYNPDTEVSNPGSVETYQGDLTIPEKVTYNDTEYPVVAVGGYAFANCRSLNSVQLPSSVIGIEGSAFRYCTSLTSVTMPGVERLYGEIFAYSALTSVSLPQSLKYFETNTFNYSELASITVDANNESFKSVDGVLYDKNITKIAAFPRKKGGTFRFPATVTVLTQYCFPDNLALDELIIPATVTKIESNAFYSDPTIKKLTIEDCADELVVGQGNSIRASINDEFGNNQRVRPMFPQIEELYWGRNLKYSSTYSPPFACSNLSKVVFGSNVTSIPKYTFYDCHSLSTVDILGGIAQWCNFDFTNPYTSPFSSTYLGEGYLTAVVLFNGSELTGAVVIPDEVTSIPSHAFQYGCSKVTSLSIHAGVTTIADGAFKGLSSLNTVSLAAENTSFKLVDNVLYNNEQTKILLFPQLRAGDYTMPSTISEIGDYQFYNCVNMTGITLSNTITAIGQYAFAGCTNLPAITIPASVESIKDHAFDNCTSLAKLMIEGSENAIKLGRGQFEYKYDTWTDYRNVGLFYSSPIRDLFIGRNIELLNVNNSYDNQYRTPFNREYLSKVGIGNKVNSMPCYLFTNCYNIKDVNFDGTIVDWCNITFENADANPFGKTPYYYDESSNNAILYLKGSPLQGQVTIPEGVTKMGAYAFYGQKSVSTVIVPSTVTTIEPYAFASATDVYINATSVIDLEDINSFGSNTNIYVLDNVASNYKQAAVWNQIAERIYPKGFLNVTVNLIAMGDSPALLPALQAFETANAEYKLNALTNLKIRGTMNGWDFMMIRNKMTNLRHLDLSEAVICDNDGGVEYYTGYHTIPGTIAPYTFYGLKNLRSVKLPDGLTSIGNRAFAESGITEMVINEGIKTIDSYAFYNCNSLTNLTIGKGLERIGYEAFSNCRSLRQLVLPTTLKTIDSEAFEWCYGLTDIDFAEGLTEIGSYAFRECRNLKDLHLPTSLRTIGYYAFNGCSNLNEVHVPSMMQQIGDYAFKNCGLKSVYAYTVVPIQINQNTFDYTGVNLYAPDNSFYAYYLNTQWGQFADVLEFPALYTNWYTVRDTDIKIYTDKPIKSADENGNEGLMEPGSGLIILGNGEQLVKKLILNWGHGSHYPSLVENGNLNIDELAFIMNMYPRRWYFFCFPCDVKIKDLKFNGSGKYVWRYYDPWKRITTGSGWTNVTGDVLKAGVGYIYQCSAEGTIEIPAYNPDYLVRNNAGIAPDRYVNLVSTAAENPQDASWNFVGNPNLSYYSLDDMVEDFNAPITVWNDDNQTYDAVVPGDDDYDIHPFQAFFIQKPSNAESVTFRAEHRMTYNQSQEKATARRLARAMKPVDENHLIVNLEMSDGTSTDKTRVVFDDSKSMNYEIGTDANKMMSMAEVPQIYTLDNKNVKYSVNTRPNNNGEVRLGFLAPATGTYTINAPRMDLRMALKDHATGMIHDFSKGAYTFLAEAGTNDDRFSLVRSFDTTGISEAGIEGLDITAENGAISISGIADQPVSVYNVKGIRMATLSASGRVNLANGTYIICAGDKTSKVIVK